MLDNSDFSYCHLRYRICLPLDEYTHYLLATNTYRSLELGLSAIWENLPAGLGLKAESTHRILAVEQHASSDIWADCSVSYSLEDSANLTEVEAALSQASLSILVEGYPSPFEASDVQFGAGGTASPVSATLEYLQATTRMDDVLVWLPTPGSAQKGYVTVKDEEQAFYSGDLLWADMRALAAEDGHTLIDNAAQAFYISPSVMPSATVRVQGFPCYVGYAFALRPLFLAPASRPGALSRLSSR